MSEDYNELQKYMEDFKKVFKDITTDEQIQVPVAVALLYSAAASAAAASKTKCENINQNGASNTASA